MSIALMTFDIFGTVLDWRTGLEQALGDPLEDGDFEALIDRQGELETEQFRPYAEIVAQSLVDELGLLEPEAARIGAEVGRWPLFADSAEAMARLRSIAPCAAITNSDRAHGMQVQEQLGFPLDGWVCAEEVGAYKPDVSMWRTASKVMGVRFSRDWWHVSAYADYDLGVARSLGLTCVFVNRPDCRAGQADLVVSDLRELAEHAARLGGR